MQERHEPIRAKTLELFAKKGDLPEELLGAEWDFFNRDIETNHCLLLDGFNSSSRGVGIWMESLHNECHEVLNRVPVNGFSYLYPGLQYDRLATWDSLGRYQFLFEQHLPSARCEVIPIGFSLGADVILLGATRLKTFTPVTIPLVVLVAPVLAPDRTLLDEFQTLHFSGDIPRPAIPVWELCGKDPRWRNALSDAYGYLANRQIHTHVVFSEDDPLASHQLPILSSKQSSYFHPHPVSPKRRGQAEERPATPEEQVKYHLRFRSATETLKEICSILEKYLAQSV